MGIRKRLERLPTAFTALIIVDHLPHANARAQHRPVAALIADLQTAIVHARPPYPTPPPDPTLVKPTPVTPTQVKPTQVTP